MNPDKLPTFLLWCAVINYGLLLWWFLLFTVTHDWLYGATGRWCHLPVEQFDALNYAGMMFFKIGIIVLNLVPYVALRIVGRSAAHHEAGFRG
ncbi:MAG TPA: hypothetical protein VMW56_07065 [Candidatus Margulisiibacteriota bacterium]|nr:hypothetical protein [Candidatus Margulisiibacteriota bacterium]